MFGLCLVPLMYINLFVRHMDPNLHIVRSKFSSLCQGAVTQPAKIMIPERKKWFQAFQFTLATGTVIFMWKFQQKLVDSNCKLIHGGTRCVKNVNQWVAELCQFFSNVTVLGMIASRDVIRKSQTWKILLLFKLATGKSLTLIKKRSLFSSIYPNSEFSEIELFDQL